MRRRLLERSCSHRVHAVRCRNVLLRSGGNSVQHVRELRGWFLLHNGWVFNMCAVFSWYLLFHCGGNLILHVRELCKGLVLDC